MPSTFLQFRPLRGNSTLGNGGRPNSFAAHSNTFDRFLKGSYQNHCYGVFISFRKRNGAESKYEFNGLSSCAGMVMTVNRTHLAGQTDGHSAKVLYLEYNYYIPMFSRRIGRVIIRAESFRVVFDACYVAANYFGRIKRKKKRI